ncbi:MAG: quinolinate synthase [Nitrospirae bacterium GWC2_46_6]|nr:MAG: quinolinate synthase [Nitrospirae bacterium GWC2_46_6]OGW22245.1 MAG: quinolinate synthase [Nitrospirae bacterium GWA2_46_11]OGW23222.1 MAG: quinolinate synthase [Nitrospirae bacterium GWB2_47_37]HAK89598.1 quinolinate synthase [Nitrospiraceae bacterium]HCZ11268.1 quinolinate synthase [Nitrospiraceae bacterium]
MPEIIDEILRLKQDKNAVILSHNYQRDEVQDIADFIGDSLELSRTAAGLDCGVIVFCGVHFMAESASILSPNKTVLLPELDAGCPMADMIQVSSARKVWKTFPGYETQPTFVFPHEFTLRDIKAKYPGVPVVAYVNTTADVKAESDICCTSANVVKVMESLPDERVICIPDRNLSMWAQKNTKKQVIAWDGFCHVHDRVTKDDILKARKEHSNAVLMAHPECRPEVLDLADHVTSTSGMLRFAKASDAKEFIVGTELGLMHRLKKESPDKVFHPLRRDMICPNMKKTTLNSVLSALKEMKNVIKVPEEIRIPAKKALDRMLEIK